MAARSRRAVSSDTKPPRVSSGPGASCGKKIPATGAASMAKPTPPMPCATAATKTVAAMAANNQGSGA
ncbi:Uncharacterised protein [Bordetella pertussis]|nr:Uncharacterised protein [Bordetella pertussis]CFU06326.1 Uncharacterised protein [Bordetella pertussis]CFW12017.1 Uncharacterised protein [Bordetella pertussis]